MNKSYIAKLILITIFMPFLGFMSAMARSTFNSSGYLKQNGHLIGELEFRNAQSGFVGITGTVWTILPDGATEGSRFINDTVLSPYKLCQLKRHDLATIANSLSQGNFIELPSEIPSQPTVNPHHITIRLGEKSSTLKLQPDETIKNALQARRNRGETFETRFLNIALKINQLIQHRCSDN